MLASRGGRRRGVYWGGAVDRRRLGWGRWLRAAVGRLRRVRRRRRRERRRRRRELLSCRQRSTRWSRRSSRRPTRRSAPATARSSTAPPRGATTCPAGPTSTSCWCWTTPRRPRCGRWRRPSPPGERPRPSRRCSSAAPSGRGPPTSSRSRSPTCGRLPGPPRPRPARRHSGRPRPTCARRSSASCGASCCACGRATRPLPATSGRWAGWPPPAPARSWCCSAALLALAGRPVPGGPRARWHGRRRPGGRRRPSALLGVGRHRGERGWRCSAAEFEQYLDAVARAAGFVDQLQLGDQ